MDKKIMFEIELCYDEIHDSDISDAMMFSLMEDAAREAGSLDPNSDVWDFLETKGKK